MESVYNPFVRTDTNPLVSNRPHLKDNISENEINSNLVNPWNTAIYATNQTNYSSPFGTTHPTHYTTQSEITAPVYTQPMYLPPIYSTSPYMPLLYTQSQPPPYQQEQDLQDYSNLESTEGTEYYENEDQAGDEYSIRKEHDKIYNDGCCSII